MSVQLELKAIKRAWLDDAASQFALIGHKLGRFTTDSLHPLLPKPDHSAWYGVLMAQLSNKGLVREVGRVASKRPEANGRKIAEWEATT
jgi:hypothetical protein